MRFTRIFVLKRKFAYARGAQSVFLGGTSFEMRFRSTGPLLYFSEKFSLGGHNSRLEGVTSSNLAGFKSEMPPWTGVYTVHLCKSHSDAMIQEGASKNITL